MLKQSPKNWPSPVDIGVPVNLVGLEDLIARWQEEPRWIDIRISLRLIRTERCFDPQRLPS